MDKKLKSWYPWWYRMVGTEIYFIIRESSFEVVAIAASPRSAGKTYEEAIGGRWKMTTPMPEKVKKIVVQMSNV